MLSYPRCLSKYNSIHAYPWLHSPWVPGSRIRSVLPDDSYLENSSPPISIRVHKHSVMWATVSNLSIKQSANITQTHLQSRFCPFMVNTSYTKYPDYLQYHGEISISFNILGTLFKVLPNMSQECLGGSQNHQAMTYIYILESSSREGPELSVQLAKHSICAHFFLQRIIPHVLGLIVISQSDHGLVGKKIRFQISNLKNKTGNRNNKILKPKAVFLESSLS